MVAVLLDTCVLSELRRADCDPRVHRRVEALQPDAMFMSAVTLGELVKGVELLPSGRRRQEIASWIEGLEHHFSERILPVDVESARIWAGLTARAQMQGMQVPMSDGLIAAIAIRHGQQIMTRNTKHFVATGALIIDPWQD